MDYNKAMKPKNGWAHAVGDSLLASAATILADRHCLQPEAVYKWAKKLCPDLYKRLLDEGPTLFPPDTRILTSVLNDLPLSNVPEFAYGRD